MPRDYYDVLGISKSASADEIKRAYRKAAHQHHPDKGGDSDKFKEINEAYQILGDENKRASYNQFGHAGVNNGGSGQGGGGFGGFSAQGGPASGWSGFEDVFGSQSNSGGFAFNFGGGGGLGDIFGDMFESAFSTVQAQVEIPLTTALIGGNLSLQNQQGEKIEIKIPEGTQDGTTFLVRGKGGQTKRGRGDLNLTVKIRYPRRLSREQRNLIEQLRQSGL